MSNYFNILASLGKHEIDDHENIVYAIIAQLFQLIMLPKYVLTIMELNWNQGYRDKKTKFNIRRQVQKRNNPDVQSAENYCLSLLNMQICDILAVVVD